MRSKCQTHNGYTNKDGYGVVTMNGKRYPAHRIAYQERYGQLFPFMIVRHKCDDPA